MILPLWALLAAQAQAQEISVRGHVGTHLRVGGSSCLERSLDDCGYLDLRDAVVMGGQAQADFASVLRARVAADLRIHGPTAVETVSDNGQVQRVQNTSVKLQDAWLAAYSEHLDLKIGAARLDWGVADGVRPVNVLTPLDLEDPSRFDRRLATPLVSLMAHNQALSFEVIAVPWFRPALLPTGVVDVLGDSSEQLDAVDAGSAEIGGLEGRVELPPTGFAQSSAGARLRVSTGVGDFALSAAHARDSFPQVGGVLRITGFATDSDRVDLGVPLLYPRVQQLGAEWHGPLPGDVLGWVELAVVKPQVVEITFSEAQLNDLAALGTIDEVPDPIPSFQTQDGQVFARWVAGVDRHLGPVYLNVQWLHGFLTERKREDLRDYGMVSASWAIVPTVAWDVRAVSDGRGAMASTGWRWLVADAAELGVGATWVGGRPDSALYAFRGLTHAGVSADLQF